MATQLQTVNAVLRRLRESTVSTVDANDYSILIAEFINDAKAELEDMWFWTVNETEVTDTILGDSSTTTYDITETTDRSFLIRRYDDNMPMAWDTTSGENQQLYDIPYKSLLAQRNEAQTALPAIERPNEFALTPDSDGRGWTIELLQAATEARTWKTYWYIPQADLAVDGTADSTEILLPSRPIFLMALYFAQYERGEAQPGGYEEKRAHTAAAAAMELDMQTHKKSDQKDMTNLEFLRNQRTQGVDW